MLKKTEEKSLGPIGLFMRVMPIQAGHRQI